MRLLRRRVTQSSRAFQPLNALHQHTLFISLMMRMLDNDENDDDNNVGDTYHDEDDGDD